MTVETPVVPSAVGADPTGEDDGFHGGDCRVQRNGRAVHHVVAGRAEDRRDEAENEEPGDAEGDAE